MKTDHRAGRVALTCALLLFGAVASAQEAGPGPAAGKPRIEVVETTVDLGAVAKGELAEAVYRIRNTGDALLKIHRVKPG